MGRLRVRWWVLLATTITFGVAIMVLAPNYSDAQRADDAVAFRQVVGTDGRGRTGAAAVVDIAFAVSYALLAVALTRSHVATNVGAALVVAGASADVVENVLMLVGVVQYDELGDGTVDVLGFFGAVKWVALCSGVVVLVVGLVLGRLRRPPQAARR